MEIFSESNILQQFPASDNDPAYARKRQFPEKNGEYTFSMRIY